MRVKTIKPKERAVMPKNLGVTKSIAKSYFTRNGSFDSALYDRIMNAKNG